MEIEDYIDQLKELYTILLEYIDSETDTGDEYAVLINFFDSTKFYENKEELKEFFRLLSIISLNHYRYRNFHEKLIKIIEYFQSEIKQTLSNAELFKLFKKDKQILLILFEKRLIQSDDSLLNLLQKRIESNDENFRLFFYPELKSIIEKEKVTKIEEELFKIDPEILTNFDEKRQVGENDSYICELIRNDSIEKFVSHVTQKNIKLTVKIKRSIFETNSFLLKKNPSLIEYASFYGSIQIFQYLKLNGVQLTSSLWLYVIHGRNPEMIHILEENHVQPDDKTYEKCLKESIKFHHNDIASYIHDNLIDDNVVINNINNKFNENVYAYSFHYFNYSFFPNDLNHKFAFFYLCQYNYYSLVSLLMESQGFDINRSIISYKMFIKEFTIIFNALHYAAKKNNHDIINLLLSDSRIKLGPNTFKECEKLTRIELPSFITKIEESLFEGCLKLSSVTIPSSFKIIGKYSFYRCESLSKITIPSSVTTIKKYAFYGCTSLTQITIPSSVEHIKKYAFRGCTSLVQINIPSSVISIGDHAFYKCSSLKDFSIPSKVDSIKDGLFGKCTSLTKISIPSSVKSIGGYAFDGCESLVQILIPSSVTSIGPYAFNECAALPQILIPSSVDSIGHYAFNGCSSLIEVAVPKSVKIIGTGAFEDCTSLRKLEFPSSLNLDSIGIESIVNVTRI